MRKDSTARRPAPRFGALLAAAVLVAGCGGGDLAGSDGGGAGSCVAIMPAVCNGLCVDISSNRQHCGACNTPCDAPGVCSGGKCKVNCGRGATFCESDRSCANLLSDVKHCGSCGTACDGGTCADGGCVPGCSATQIACGGVCVDPLNDPAHCGGCGQACAMGQACVEGACSLGCPAGLANCDGRCVDLASDAANCGRCGATCPTMPVGDGGVATPLCSNDQCAMSCGQGTVNCPAGCVSLLSDPRNCGGCGVICPLAAVCSLGACVSNCGQGLVRCGRSCVNLAGDPGNCGACGNVCRADQVCSRGGCVAACAPGEVNCNGVCADPGTDSMRCGGCGTPCKGGEVCVSGACAAACPGGFSPCATTCRDLANDPRNCGACGNVCPPIDHGQPACQGGACVATCAPGFGDCNGLFRDGCEAPFDSSDDNCGACGKGCAVQDGKSKCVAGGCTIASCLPGFLDCDTDVKNGCEVAANDDARNCGKCGLACPVPPNGKAACNGGACDVTCDAGRGNCDGKPMNGCEVNLLTDPANCSSCGTACPAVTNGTPGCSDGGCVVAACNAGFADCDGDARNGCEVNLNNDVKRCGGCGRSCPTLPNAVAGCNGGVCGVAACLGGFADCDKDPTNGCEVALNTSTENCGSCGNTCPALPNGWPICTGGNCTLGGCLPGFRNCDNAPNNGCEIDTRNDVKNCGGCGTACPPGGNGQLACFGGACTVANCAAGFADCDGKPLNGCETALNRIDNCGSCGTLCQYANAVVSCASTQCQLTGCLAGWGNCDQNPANGCEKSLLSDVNNCGGCAAKCGQGQACCNGLCTDIISDGRNCGACGNACAVGTSCLLGACCSPGQTNCGQGCVDLRTSNTNCGACLFACPAATFCSNGKCCPNGFANCGGACVDIRFDNNNCGACGRACTANNTCVSGICCSNGLTNCGGACVSLLTNAKNCGACGRACGANQDCVAGVCCTAGYKLCISNRVYCADLNNDATNCGMCGRTCAAQCCSGSCVNLSTDAANCGACGVACPNNRLCLKGICCPLFTVNCNGKCSDLNEDANCGACGNACTAGKSCCGSKCVDTNTDVGNCGICGNSCLGNVNGHVCLNGVCGCNVNGDCSVLKSCINKQCR